MPTITTIKEFHRYLSGVMYRSRDHAKNVREVILVMTGAILWRMEGELRVRAQDGDFKNCMWVHIGGNRYAISYNHKTVKIEVREENLRGRVLTRISHQKDR